MKKSIPYRVWRFYADGFRSMTWGRGLWVLVLIKLFIMFGVLRIFFFRPHMAGMNEQDKTEYVLDNLSNPMQR